MKGIIKENRIIIVGIISTIVFWAMMISAFNQNYNFIQAYGVSALFGWGSAFTINDLIKAF
jgi:hypothetical protein